MRSCADHKLICQYLHLHVSKDERHRLWQLFGFCITDDGRHHFRVELISDASLFIVWFLAAYLVEQVAGGVQIFITDQSRKRKTCEQENIYISSWTCGWIYKYIHVFICTWIWFPDNCFPAGVEVGGVCAQSETPTGRSLIPRDCNLSNCESHDDTEQLLSVLIYIYNKNALFFIYFHSVPQCI